MEKNEGLNNLKKKNLLYFKEKIKTKNTKENYDFNESSLLVADLCSKMLDINPKLRPNLQIIIEVISNKINDFARRCFPSDLNEFLNSSDIFSCFQFLTTTFSNNISISVLNIDKNKGDSKLTKNKLNKLNKLYKKSSSLLLKQRRKTKNKSVSQDLDQIM